MNKQEYIKHYETVFDDVCDSILDVSRKFTIARNNPQAKNTAEDNFIKNIYSIFVNRETAEIDLEKMHACMTLDNMFRESSFHYHLDNPRYSRILEKFLNNAKYAYDNCTSKFTTEEVYDVWFDDLCMEYKHKEDNPDYAKYLFINPHTKRIAIYVQILKERNFIKSFKFYFTNKFDMDHLSAYYKFRYIEDKIYGSYRSIVSDNDIIDSVYYLALSLYTSIYSLITPIKIEEEEK